MVDNATCLALEASVSSWLSMESTINVPQSGGTEKYVISAEWLV